MTDFREEFKLSGAESWHRTRMHIVEFRHMWKIENFRYFGNRNSPVFASKNCSHIKWKIEIQKTAIDFYLILHLVSKHVKPFDYDWDCAVLKKDEKGLSNLSYAAEPLSAPKTMRTFKIKDLDNNGFLKQDSLALVFEIKMVKTDEITKDEEVASGGVTSDKVTPDEVSGSKAEPIPVNNDLSRFLDTGKFSDITLVVDDEHFHVHKIILSVHSTIFETMFDKMDETDTTCVVITSFSHKVIQEMLTFIYSNKTPNIDEVAAELLEAANAYDLKGLQQLCESVLHRNLAIETAIETLILANRHNVEDLKVRSLEVIKANVLTIKETDKWQDMMKNFPQLVNDIVSYIAKP